MKYFISQIPIFSIIFGFINGVLSQDVDVSNKDRCLRLNEMNVCNAATQSGCSWCTEDWGCMFVSTYDVVSQTSIPHYSCPEPCIEGDTECYKIKDDSNLLQPFFFYLSTRNGMVCHLQHTNEVNRIHTFHCDASCRKALMNDFGYCQFYDDNGKEIKDYTNTGAIVKKSNTTRTIIIVVVIVVAIALIAFIFKVYLDHHNKILEERHKDELKDSKLENDRFLEAQIEQHRQAMNERLNNNNINN